MNGSRSHIYIKKGHGERYLNKILKSETAVYIGSAYNSDVYQIDNCTLISKYNSYKGSWHEYVIQAGSQKRESLDMLIEKIKHVGIEVK